MAECNPCRCRSLCFKRIPQFSNSFSTVSYTHLDVYKRQAPYIHRNELLVDYGNFLSEENRRYVGRHNQDKRTLVELKKILEIEGLLDTYSHIFDNDDITGCRYPINNYSGLNSLRARLKHSYWDGSSPLDTTILQTENGKPSYNYTACRNVQSLSLIHI